MISLNPKPNLSHPPSKKQQRQGTEGMDFNGQHRPASLSSGVSPRAQESINLSKEWYNSNFCRETNTNDAKNYAYGLLG